MTRSTTKTRPTAKMVDIERLRVHPDNIRLRMTGIGKLADSIAQVGIEVPLVAHQKFKREPGKQDLELIYGHRRLAAATRLGLTRIPVEIRPYMEPDEILLMMLTERMREPHEDAAVADAVRKLKVRHGMDPLAIAARMGTSQAQVNAWLNGQGDLPEVDLIAPNTPSPAIPAQRNHAPHTGLAPRRNTKPARNPAPHMSARRVYDLVAAVDGGSMDAETAVKRMRAMLKGWSPS